jgi:hypothetical protein
VNSPSASRSRHSKQALAKNSLFSPEVLNLFNKLTATIIHKRENVQSTSPKNGLNNKTNNSSCLYNQREVDFVLCHYKHEAGSVWNKENKNRPQEHCTVISQNKF